MDSVRCVTQPMTILAVVLCCTAYKCLSHPERRRRFARSLGLQQNNELVSMPTTVNMAEGGGNWWGSWIQAAKDKSAEVLEFVRRDLDEFSHTVQQEASNVVSNTATALKEKLKFDESRQTAVKKNVSNILGQVSTVFNPKPEDIESEAVVIRNSEPVILNKLQAQLFALATDPKTYLTDPPEKLSAEYEKWAENVDLEGRQSEMLSLITACPEIRDQYDKLVPAEVTHLLFWSRYFFRRSVIESESIKLEELKSKASRRQPKSDDFAWDDDEAFGGHLELSEEEQIRLLAEYQKECETAVTTGGALPRSQSTEAAKGSLSPKSTEETLSSGKSTRGSVSEFQVSSPRSPESGTRASDSLSNSSVSATSPTDLTVLTASSSKAVDDRASSATDILDRKSSSLLDDDRNESSLSVELGSEQEIKTRDKGDLVVVGMGSSSRTTPSSADKESNDDDWVKEFDLEGADAELKCDQESLKDQPSTQERSGTAEDWEEW